jgi:SAM-dependent methyltransferase
MGIVDKINDRIRSALFPYKYKHNSGYCNICEAKTIFFEFKSWLRDNYKCGRCGSIPRNRALINTLNTFYPDWKNLRIHESSPGGPVSEYLAKKAKYYNSSHYYEDVPRGVYKGAHRSEDLTNLTFNDQDFDLFITADVFEHVFEPQKAFSEIARVLRPGGAHIFTMPWYPGLKSSLQRAVLNKEKIELLQEAVYHGNPIDDNGSLVTYDWGQDFCDIIYGASGLYTTIYLKKDRSLGLEAEMLEVFISKKKG